MKFRFKVQKRSRMIVTMSACALFVWMMVVKFGLAVEDLLEFLWVSVVLVMAIMIVAAPLALVIRWLSERTGKKQTEYKEEP